MLQQEMKVATWVFLLLDARDISEYESLTMLEDKRESLDYKGDYSILANDPEIKEANYRKFPFIYKKRPRSTRDDARISGSENGTRTWDLSAPQNRFRLDLMWQRFAFSGYPMESDF